MQFFPFPPRSFNRDLRRAKSFKAHKPHIGVPLGLVGVSSGGNVTFSIKRSQYGRKGWKVMPAPAEAGEENLNLKTLDIEIIDRVMARIREIELSGHVVPERMTMKV
jgi:hypothetical protein